MEDKQSKNFYVQLLEDLPAAWTSAGSPVYYTNVGKSVGVPVLYSAPNSKTINGNSKRIEVYNYTPRAYVKGDVVYVSVDNFGFARVTQSQFDSGNFVGIYNNGGVVPYGTPTAKRVLYAKSETDYNQMSSVPVSDISGANMQPRTAKANPFNFRPGQPCLFAPARGFGYWKMDAAANSPDANLKNNLSDGYIPVFQDARPHFRIPAGDTKIYNYGDKVFVKRASSGMYDISTGSGWSFVAVCDSEKKNAVDYDFYMPFRVAGMYQSFDEMIPYGVGRLNPGDRFGYEPTSAADPRLEYTFDRADFVTLRNGLEFYSPVFTHLFQVVAGTNYPVAVLWDFSTDSPNGITAQPVDIPLSESQWIALYGQGTLKPEICQGDHITCIVDASGSPPHIRPVSFPTDYGAGCCMFWNTPPSARLWVNVTDDVVNPNFQPGDIGVYGNVGGGWFNKVALDPVNGTDLNLRSMGGWYQKQRNNTVLVMGNW